MNKIIIIGGILLLITACSKTDDRQNGSLKCDCSHYLSPLEPVSCYGTICQSDTCQTYFNIWKELFISRNQISQEYYDNHITPCSTTIHKWNDGISFEIFYKIKIDWAEERLLDKFIIWISPGTNGLYPAIDIPRNILLSKNQIVSVLDGYYFSSRIWNISPVNNLKYPSVKEAMKDLILAANIDTLCTSSVYFEQPNRNYSPSGHPFLKASGVLNWNENKCIEASIDLLTGETSVTQDACMIIFCFTKGTQISLPDGLTKSIEKVKNGDKILSVNLATMKVTNDVVQRIDSTLHKNIMTITFNDKTTNSSTFDHPYYVKRKGWCSYKPAETMQKYNLKSMQLQIGDTCFKYQNNKITEVKVMSISEENGSKMTYNLSSLKKNKNFFANGILVSNEDK